MAFNDNDVSLFDQNSWKESGLNKVNENKKGFATGHSVIKITPNYYFWGKGRNDLSPVIGVILNRVSISIDSEWQRMGVPKLPLIKSIGDFAGPVSDYTAMAGAGDFGAVWMSKQLWRKNGYLRIAPEFRIVDWDGTGKPIYLALQIAKMCLPGASDTNAKLQELYNDLLNLVHDDVENLVKGGVELVGNIGDKLIGGLKKVAPDNVKLYLNNVGAVAKNVFDIINAETVSKTILEDAHDLITLKKAPPPVKIQIGQYFYHPDMVIKNATFNFSKEVSDLGPLYVDVTLELETRKIMTGLNDVGFVGVGKMASRAKIVKSMPKTKTKTKSDAADIKKSLNELNDKIATPISDQLRETWDVLKSIRLGG